MTGSQHVLRLLSEAEGGNREVLDRLVPLVYEDLRQIAHHVLRRRNAGDSLQTTALVHETYLQLLGQSRTSWQGDTHVLGVAATAMRRILVNRVKALHRLKRGDAHGRAELHETDLVTRDPDGELLAVDEAVERLARIDPRKARLVELRFFTGLTLEEAARGLGVSVNTAKRDWAVAKLWILRDMERSRNGGA